MRTSFHMLAFSVLLPYSVAHGQAENVPSPKRGSLFLQQGHSSNITGASFSADKRWLVTSGTDETARLWEVATGREVRVFRGHRDMVLAVALSADGQWLATSSGGTVLVEANPAEDTVERIDPDISVRLWNVATGENVRTIKQIKGNFHLLALSPDGKRLVTAPRTMSYAFGTPPPASRSGNLASWSKRRNTAGPWFRKTPSGWQARIPRAWLACGTWKPGDMPFFPWPTRARPDLRFAMGKSCWPFRGKVKPQSGTSRLASRCNCSRTCLSIPPP